MKLHKTRTCGIYTTHDCPAIEGYGFFRKWCSLGYKVTIGKNKDMKPLEPCPRPHTLKEFAEIHHTRVG